MILRKAMSLLGIGSAKIDLILEKERFHPGEDVHGYFLLKGGTIEQQLKRIDCDLVMVDKKTGIEEILDSATILTSKLIEADEENKLPFTFKIPDTIQGSNPNVSYRFNTKLTFNQGVESLDEDVIHITS
ncbi:sporulation protein [Bacillus taeanensis]|uniref:Sporulation protein n=1 Tax=Bacillus taeanensis TaxID=273032 RepID=A0A366XUH0_9BACI|nr:sporulation protein [Bacillus taeanensis]RBW68795.1 sporulation protein [Bacillus taeanensis]